MSNIDWKFEEEDDQWVAEAGSFIATVTPDGAWEIQVQTFSFEYGWDWSDAADGSNLNSHEAMLDVEEWLEGQEIEERRQEHAIAKAIRAERLAELRGEIV